MDKAKTAVAILLTFVVIAALGMAFVLQESTLVRWWIPVLASFPVAAALALPLERAVGGLTGWSSRAARYAAAFAAAFSITVGTVYTLNFYLSSRTSARSVEAVIAGKHSEERHRSRRAGRRYTASGEKYYEYYLDVLMPDSTRRKIKVSASGYVNTRSGSPATLTIERGLFGMDVIKDFKTRK